MSMQSDLRNPELGYFDEGMNLADAALFQSAIQPFGAATSLPPVAYRSKAFFELENEKVWTRSWVVIGLLQQIPNPGDLLPFTLGFHGVHVQRNRDGSVSARLNRHQHGGCRFVPEQCRTGAQTKCSITSCNYTRDADVMPAGENGENTDLMYKFVGLVPEKLAPVKCETWGPFIFINLDPEAGPLADYLGGFPAAMGHLLGGSLYLAGKQWIDFQSNWKMAGAALTELGQPLAQPRSNTVPDEIPAYAAGGDLASWMLADPESAGESAAEGMHWLFPNAVLAVSRTHVAVTLLQATGMGKCLCRFFLLASGSARSSGEASDATAGLFGRWQSALLGARQEAERLHKEAVLIGTPSRPGTTAEDVPIEANPCSHMLNRFVADRVVREHHYYWNAPIMDAAMLTRGYR
jgi:hypothetical protein